MTQKFKTELNKNFYVNENDKIAFKLKELSNQSLYDILGSNCKYDFMKEFENIQKLKNEKLLHLEQGTFNHFESEESSS